MVVVDAQDYFYNKRLQRSIIRARVVLSGLLMAIKILNHKGLSGERSTGIATWRRGIYSAGDKSPFYTKESGE